MLKLAATFTVLFFGYVQAQNANCDFAQNVAANTTYYIYSPNYPNSYTPGVQCRWIATCPVGYNCRLDCPVINLPQSTTCSIDRFLVSKTGDPQLTSADYYCGTGTVSAVSTGRNMAIGLTTSNSSPGGTVYCRLTAQIDTSTSTCSCGYSRGNRIVGGQDAIPNEFPMMVGIIYAEEGVIKCGGVIISNTYILTAAHCVVGRSASRLAVVVGEHDTSASSSTRKVFLVTSFLVHPQYTASNYDYDIAILSIQGQITFTPAVGPVCLPFKYANSDFNGAPVTLLGWGTLFPGGPTSKTLQKVTLNVISQTSCQQSISALTPRQMCTYSSGKDACQDDSGGPALYTDNTNGLLYSIGIISYGRFCASSSPGVTTRVTALLNWIVTNAPANYCRK